MNDLLKFTIIITIVEFIGFILLQCVLLLSKSMDTLKQLLFKGGQKDEKVKEVKK